MMDHIIFMDGSTFGAAGFAFFSTAGWNLGVAHT